jgi:hypothetical protein
LAGVDPSFDRSMILFHDVVQVRTGTTPTPTTKFAFLLQFRHRLGIGGVAADVDDPGARVTRSMQGVLEEALGGSSIPPGGKQEIDRSTGRVDGPVQVGPLAELLSERGLSADHTTIWRWVQCYAPELNKRCRRELKPTNGSWRVDETYIRVKPRRYDRRAKIADTIPLHR